MLRLLLLGCAFTGSIRLRRQVIPIETSLRNPKHGVFVIATGMGVYGALCAVFGSVMYGAGFGKKIMMPVAEKYG